jgi:MFS family permease
MASTYCSHCGERNPARARYCHACGGRLRSSAASAPARPPDNLPSTEQAPSESEPAGVAGGPKLLWWTIPADSILHNASFRALMAMRLASETAINAIGYGMLVQVVRETQSGFQASLVTVSTVAPAALFGVVGGTVVDRSNKRLMLVLANLVRALLCGFFLLTSQSVGQIYLLLWIITIASQFASPAESAIVPRVVAPPRIAGANSFANLCEAGGQLLGMAILAPIFVKVTGSAAPLIAVCGVIFLFAAVRALAIRTRVAPEAVERAERAGSVPRLWLAGTRESLAEAWFYLSSNRPVFITVLLLVLASTANLVLVTLAPRFTQEVLDLPPEFAVFVFGPAVIGMLSGLALVPRIAHRVRPRVLVLAGFMLMVVSLLLVGFIGPITDALMSLNLLRLYDPGPLGRGPLGHSDGQLGTVMFLAIPVGFSFSVVQVAANTYLNERVPLGMQGRVFALQGAIKNATAIIPLLALGALASLVGVQPVLIVTPLLIFILALYGASKFHQLARRQSGPAPGAGQAAAGEQGTRPA